MKHPNRALSSNPSAHTPHTALRSCLPAIQTAMVVTLGCLALFTAPLRLGAACSYALSPTITNIAPTASTGSFAVTTTGGCGWTAVANSGWITVTSGSNGTGSGTITYAVAANTSGAFRGSTITAATRTFTIRQNGDTTDPTNRIISPAPGQHWSNAVFTAQGTASDDVEVANVRWRLNGGAWSDATTLNDWTNWAADLSLVPGTNTLGVYAVDTSDNTSVTNSVSFIYVNTQTSIIGLDGNLNFGAVVTNTTATRTLTITNSGNSTLNVTGISYPAGFSGALSGSIAAGDSTNVTVTFAPTAVTSYGGTVTVTSDATSGANTISASGSGTSGFVATRIIGVSGDLTFGAVETNTTATRTLTITNNGNSTLNITGISYPAGFSGALSGSVAAGGSTNVTVTFAPTAVTSYGGTVTVTSDATSGANTISASGSGTSGFVATRMIGVSGDLAFGAVVTNTTATRTLTIANNGNSTLNVTGISYPAGFSGAWSGSVAAGGSTNVTVTFAPIAVTSYGGTVTVTSDATSGANTISASGSGTLGFVATRIISVGGNLNFGTVATNTTATRTLTITNNGNSTLNVSGISYPAGFSGAWSGGVTASGLINVTVTFAPTALTSYGGTVTVNSDATSGANTISASGSGTTNQAQPNYQRLLSFGPGPELGSMPVGQLVEASDGWLYGTTYGGGTYGLGTLFRISKAGTGFTPLRSLNDSDGTHPTGGLVEASDGSLCGTASSGGAGQSGTVFKLNKDGGGFTLLHIFSGGTNDGAQPLAGLAQGNGGVLYGTTFSGGARDWGTVFSLSPNGTGYTLLHQFTGITNDGGLPFASLRQGLDGALYGTTQAGGSNDLGTVFKLNPNGTGYGILHEFRRGGDGRQPNGRLMQGGDGLLYGTTSFGGTNDTGTIFKIGTNGGAYAVLKDIPGGVPGDKPLAGLVQGVDGALYGSTQFGGSNDGGTLFKLRPDGSGYALVHDFSGSGGDGGQPLAGLMLGSDGAFYGSTYWGGDYTANGVNGTLFKLDSSRNTVVITSIIQVSGGFLLSFAGGTPGVVYQIKAAPNLAGSPWQVIGSSTSTINGTFGFFDSTAANFPSRFYRSWGN